VPSVFKQHINNTSAIENRSQLTIFSPAPPPHQRGYQDPI